MSQIRQSRKIPTAISRNSLIYLSNPFGTTLAVVTGKPANEPELYLPWRER